MPYGIREFEERVREICSRWYCKGGNIQKLSVSEGDPSITESRLSTILRPIEVWERPYAQGEGFMGDSLVYVIGEFDDLTRHGIWKMPDYDDILWLKEANWMRVRAEQANLFKRMVFNRQLQADIDLRSLQHDTEEYAKENRVQYRVASHRLGFKKHALRSFYGEKAEMGSRGN